MIDCRPEGMIPIRLRSTSATRIMNAMTANMITIELVMMNSP